MEGISDYEVVVQGEPIHVEDVTKVDVVDGIIYFLNCSTTLLAVNQAKLDYFKLENEEEDK